MIMDGKVDMVYGSMIGNIFTTLLVNAGVYMASGGLAHKEQISVRSLRESKKRC